MVKPIFNSILCWLLFILIVFSSMVSAQNIKMTRAHVYVINSVIGFGVGCIRAKKSLKSSKKKTKFTYIIRGGIACASAALGQSLIRKKMGTIESSSKILAWRFLHIQVGNAGALIAENRPPLSIVSTPLIMGFGFSVDMNKRQSRLILDPYTILGSLSCLIEDGHFDWNLTKATGGVPVFTRSDGFRSGIYGLYGERFPGITAGGAIGLRRQEAFKYSHTLKHEMQHIFQHEGWSAYYNGYVDSFKSDNWFTLFGGGALPQILYTSQFPLKWEDRFFEVEAELNSEINSYTFR